MLRKREIRDEPWNDLELPDGHKNLVQSLIESHTEGNASRKLHFDLVRAKGMPSRLSCFHVTNASPAHAY